MILTEMSLYKGVLEVVENSLWTTVRYLRQISVLELIDVIDPFTTYHLVCRCTSRWRVLKAEQTTYDRFRDIHLTSLWCTHQRVQHSLGCIYHHRTRHETSFFNIKYIRAKTTSTSYFLNSSFFHTFNHYIYISFLLKSLDQTLTVHYVRIPIPRHSSSILMYYVTL